MGSVSGRHPLKVSTDFEAGTPTRGRKDGVSKTRDPLVPTPRDPTPPDKNTEFREGRVGGLEEGVPVLDRVPRVVSVSGPYGNVYRDLP